MITPTATELRNASGGLMRLLGEAPIIMCNDKHSAHSTVLVTADLNHAALIGWQDLQRLRVIPASFPAVAAVAQCYQEIKTKTLDAFPLVFSDTLDDRPMCAQKCASTSRTAAFHTGFPHHDRSRSAFRNQRMRKLQNILQPASLPLVMNPLNGVHPHSSFLKGMESGSA